VVKLGLRVADYKAFPGKAEGADGLNHYRSGLARTGGADAKGMNVVARIIDPLLSVLKFFHAEDYPGFG
jgi:hypothetical protein